MPFNSSNCRMLTKLLCCNFPDSNNTIRSVPPANGIHTPGSDENRCRAPSRVRGGLLYQARFNITARKKLDQAELVLARGWIHDLTINTMEPSPTSETSQDGKLGLDLGPIPAGQTYVLFIDYQVNPTNVGRQDQTVTLYDGNRALVTLHRTLTVFP